MFEKNHCFCLVIVNSSSRRLEAAKLLKVQCATIITKRAILSPIGKGSPKCLGKCRTNTLSLPKNLSVSITTAALFVIVVFVELKAVSNIGPI